MEIGRNTADRYFIHSYCRTCHSFQGSSIDDKITILDWRFKFVNRKWLYTAVTRATELRNVMFYSGRTANHTMQDERILDKYLIAKVAHYRKQDRDAGRKINQETYVTPEWLKAQYGKNCSSCGDCLTFEIRGNQVVSNLTADRFGNGLDHTVDNVIPLCCTCNQRKAGWN
jgi:5-methylcytosine-specific restriction endonuclease McrA